MKNNKFHWLVQPVFSYQEPNTSIIVDVLLETGITQKENNWPNHFPLRISVALRDARVSTRRVKVELEYLTLKYLTDALKVAYNNIDKACIDGRHIPISRFAFKKTKNLIFDFTQDANAKNICRIKITDPMSDNLETYVSCQNLRHMVCLLNSCKDNYPVIASNMMAVSRQGWHFESIKNKLDIWLPQISSVVKAGLNRETAKSLGIDKSYLEEEENNNISVNPNENENGSVDNIPTPVLSDVSDSDVNSNTPNLIQDEFNSLFSDSNSFDKFDLNIPESTYIGDEDEAPRIQIVNPFITTFLQDDLSNLIPYTTSVYSTSDKTDIDAFLPLHNILDKCGIEPDIISSILDTSYYTQFLLQYYIKVTIRDVLCNRKTFEKVTPPTLMFKEQITTDSRTSELYDACRGMLISLVCYSLLNKRLDQLVIGGHSKNDLEEIHRTFFVFKTLISPFIFSLDIPDPETFKQDLNSDFQKFYQLGIITGIEEKYSNIVPEGRFVVPMQGFLDSSETFINVIRNMENLTTVGDYVQEISLAKEYKLPILSDNDIPSKEQLRDLLFKELRKSRDG